MVLRKLKVEDLNFLLDVRNDDSTRKFLENNSVFTYEECLNWFKTNNPLWYVIEVGDKPVGYVRTNGDEIGCDIHPDFRRMGFAKQAYQEYLKDKDFASLWVFEDNFAKKLYEKLGFKRSGLTKLIRNKEYIHMVWNRV
jgi:ribosomal protein S18 acetylase RimI-like enzyme